MLSGVWHSAIEKQLPPGGMESVEVLNVTQSLMFVRDVCNAAVRHYEAYRTLPTLRREKSRAEQGGR